MTFFSHIKRLIANRLSIFTGHTRIRNRAKRLVEIGEPGHISFFEESINQYPRSQELKLLFAKYLNLQNNHKNALSVVDDLISSHSADDGCMLECAILLERLGASEKAEALYERLSSSTTSELAAFASFRRGRLYVFKDEKRALDLLAESICIDGNSHAADQLRTREWKDHQALKRALDTLLNADESAKTTAYYLAVSDIAIRLGKSAGAIKHTQLATLSNIGKTKSLQRKLGLRGSQLKNLKFPSRLQTWPQFLIIGTMKSGTTSLYNYVVQHPQVIESVRKEVRGFKYSYLMSREWYQSHFPPIIPEGSITGEASPGYFSMPIHSDLKNWIPGIKLICIVRNPVRRTLSHYNHRMHQTVQQLNLDRLNEQVDYFENLRASDDEMESLLFDERDKVRRFHVALSFYYFYLRRWIREFGRKNVLLLTLRELKESPDAVMNRVFQFLELEDFPCSYAIKNQGKYSSDQHQQADLEYRLCKLFQPSVEKLESQFGIRIGDI